MASQRNVSMMSPVRNDGDEYGSFFATDDGEGDGPTTRRKSKRKGYHSDVFAAMDQAAKKPKGRPGSPGRTTAGGFLEFPWASWLVPDPEVKFSVMKAKMKNQATKLDEPPS